MLQTVNVNCEHAYNCIRKMTKANVVRILYLTDQLEFFFKVPLSQLKLPWDSTETENVSKPSRFTFNKCEHAQTLLQENCFCMKLWPSLPFDKHI